MRAVELHAAELAPNTIRPTPFSPFSPQADAVAVCSGGRVVEVGPHAELLAAGGAFAALAAHQAFGTDGRGGSRVVGAGRPGAA